MIGTIVIVVQIDPGHLIGDLDRSVKQMFEVKGVGDKGMKGPYHRYSHLPGEFYSQKRDKDRGHKMDDIYIFIRSRL